MLSDNELRQALQRAFNLGQAFWRQADSERASDHRKADETQAKFYALVDETVLAMYPGEPDWRAREAAGMEHVTFHDLRRSCGTLMIEAGVDLYVVSSILGHSTVTVTQKHYAHMQTKRMAEGLAAAFGTAADYTEDCTDQNDKRPRRAVSA